VNAYADLTTLKSEPYLNISGTDNDTILRKELETVSREIDEYCRRHFYCVDATKYYDGRKKELILNEDILSITSVKLDLNNDGVYEVTMAETDYHSWPYNELPWESLIIRSNGSYGSFASGVVRGVEIIGVWGHGNGASEPYEPTSVTVTAAGTDDTELAVSSEGTLSAGHTIKVESEQIYILSATADGSKKITVRRGVNGTVAAAHDVKTAAIYEYPAQIRKACLIQTVKAIKRSETSYQDYGANPETGQQTVAKGWDTDARRELDQFVKTYFERTE
jgi:hypothetical protein